MPARQRFLFTRREDWKSRALLPVDTYTAFRFFHKEWVENSTLPLLYSIRWQCFTFSEERDIWHADLTAFPQFYPKRGLEKIQTSSASQRVFGLSGFFPQEWIDQSALLLPLDTLTVVSFVSRADWKSSFNGFSLRYADRLLFPQSGWTDPALHSFSRYSKRRQCLLFCDSTRLFMWSVLWFSHFVPSALVCVSNPVPKGIFRLFCRLTFKQEALHA